MFGYYLDIALHSLKRNRMLTALMVLAIGLGIGASMTTLTVPTKDGSHAEPPDMMDYRSAVDLWSAHRADR